MRKEVFFLAYHLHWGQDEILELPVEDRWAYVRLLSDQLEREQGAIEAAHRLNVLVPADRPRASEIVEGLAAGGIEAVWRGSGTGGRWRAGDLVAGGGQVHVAVQSVKPGERAGLLARHAGEGDAARAALEAARLTVCVSDADWSQLLVAVVDAVAALTGGWILDVGSGELHDRATFRRLHDAGGSG
jgi:hypothetical protein